MYLKHSFAVTVLLFIGQFPLLSKVLPGHVPTEIAGLQPISAFDGKTPMRLAIGLSTRNSKDLSVLIDKLYDPTTPNYRRFLNVGQFADMFGQTKQNYEAVSNFVLSNGLKVDRAFSNRLVIDISGLAETVEKAFNIKLYQYSNSVDARIFFGADANPTVPDSLPIICICGLENYYKPHSLSRMGPAAAAGAVSLGTGSKAGTFIGTDFRAAYAPGVTQTGSGQVVGLFALDGYDINDITHYANAAGITVPNLVNIQLDGTDGKPHDIFNQIECTLDINMVNAMAPGLVNIVCFQGNYANYLPLDILNSMATYTPRISQFSCSFAWGDNVSSSAVDSIFQEMAAQGQSFFQASGDGDANWAGETYKHPLDDPYVTLVGGTALTTSGPGGTWQSEKVWNACGSTGSGGGISSVYSIPNWQQGVSMAANGGSLAFRNTPDVSMVATNIYLYIETGGYDDIYNEEGTSIAAPLWAGLASLANQRTAGTQSPPIGFLNPAIYQAAKGYSYNNFFHDITVGNNQTFCDPSSGPYEAALGFDLCTG